MWAVTLLSLLFALYIKVSVCEDMPCAERQTQFGAVCVCNSSYCDTVERPPPLIGGRYYRYTTSSDTPGFHRTTGYFTQTLPNEENQTVTFTVNPNIKHQEIYGFGGAFTDSSGAVVNSLPLAAQDQLIETYFGKTGVEYNIGRVPIASTDFSPRLYTYDDVPYDEELKYFNLTEEDYSFKIPLITKAMSVSPNGIKLVGSIFSSPKWMKVNDTWETSYVKQKYFDIWARYHIMFLDAYADSGIKFWSLTQGNEVMLGLNWPGVLAVSTAALPHDHIRWVEDYLAPQLAASNHGHIKLLIMDDIRLFAKLWMSRFSRHSEAYSLVEGIALHWYFDYLIPESEFEAMAEDLYKSFPDKINIYTEASVNMIFRGEPVELGSWERGAYYMNSIIKNLNLWTSGFVDWNLVLDTTGGPNINNMPTDAAIIVNASSGEFYKNPIFYGLGHFSKFIPPGSRRIDVQSNQNKSASSDTPKPRTTYNLFQDSSYLLNTSEGHDRMFLPHREFPVPSLPIGVCCVATSNSDNSSTVIVLNTMDTDVNVTIEDTVSGYITTTLQAKSINTFVYWPNEHSKNKSSFK